MKQIVKQTVSLVLVLVMLAGMMPMQAFATEGTQETEAVEVVTEVLEEETEPSEEEEESSEPSEPVEEPEGIHEHDYEAVVTDPTCTEEGYTTYTCACGDSYVSDYLDATGNHTYENGICNGCGSATSPYLQQLPEDITGCSNLYAILIPTKGYYTATKYDTSNGEVLSVVIPVEPGDRIAASSFASKAENMGSVNAIRVTYLLRDKIVSSLSPSDVYNSYTTDGYITVPDGVDAVCVPWWKPSERNWLTLCQINKEFAVHRPTSVSEQAPTCTESGYTEGEICEICNASLGAREEIPPAGHVYSDDICTICGAVNLGSILGGKYVSILGDSISTFNGYSNNAAVNTTIGGNGPRYDAGTADTKPGSYCLLESVHQTWWMDFVNRSDMNLLVNNSWAGSQVFGGKTSDGRVIPAAYLDRCVNLHDNTLDNNPGNAPVNPDVIFVYLGINDYNFNRSKVGAGVVDYAGLVNSDGVYVTPANFGEAYGIMLHKMQNAYPNAQIFAMTLLPENLYSVDQTAWEQHNAYIRGAAEYYDIPVVDLAENCAITWENYSGYMMDKIHPTTAGMKLISDCMEAEVIAYYKENLPHTHTYKSTVAAPTCTERGYTTYTCDCGDSYVDDYMDATGHTYKNGICTGCGEKKPTEITLGDFAVAGVGKTALSKSDVLLSQKTLIAVPYCGATLHISVSDGYRVKVHSGNNYNNINQVSDWLSDGETYTLPLASIYMRVSIQRADGGKITLDELETADVVVSYESDSDICEDNADVAQILMNTELPVLIHLSDIHGDTIRAERAASFADFVGADALLASGDLTAYEPDDWGNALFASIDNYPNVNFIYGIGNHDTKIAASVYYESIYNSYFKGNPDTSGGETYYYRDLADQKLRIVAVNQQEGASTTTSGGTCYSQAQVDWLVEALKTTPAGYGVVLMYHSPETTIAAAGDPDYSEFFQVGNRYDNPTNSYSGYSGTFLMDLVDAFMLRENFTWNYSEKDGTSPVTLNADFTNVAEGVEFIAHVTGHVHSDSITYLPGTACKQLLLGVTCTNSMYGEPGGYYGLADYSDLNRVGNTSAQDAFNAYIIDRENKTVRVLRVGARQTVSGDTRDDMTIPYSVPFENGEYLFDTEGLIKLDLSNVEWVNYGFQAYGVEPTYYPGQRWSTDMIFDVPYDGVTFYIKINAPYELGIRSGKTDTSMSTNYYWLNNKELISGDKNRGYVYAIPAGHEKFILSLANVTRDGSNNVTNTNHPISFLELQAAGVEIWYRPEPAEEPNYPFNTADKVKLDLSSVEWVNYGYQPYGPEPTYHVGTRLTTNMIFDVPYEGVTFYIKINAPYELGIRSGETGTAMDINLGWLNNKYLPSGNSNYGFAYAIPAGHHKFILTIGNVTRNSSNNVSNDRNPITLEELEAAGLEIWYVPCTHTYENGVCTGCGEKLSFESMSLRYDDHLDMSGKTVEIIDAGTPTSYRVGYGVEENKVLDTAVVTRKGENLVATGIGTAKVKIDGVLYEVTVEAAPISLLLLIGQSNMRGSEGNADQSIVCPDGMVYATYGDDRGDDNTAMTISNATWYAPSSLTGAYSGINVEGTTDCLSGYPVNSLTEDGAGKIGPDSGFAYEWVKQTGEKVWVVNAAHGGTSINVWQPGTTEYEQCQALFTACQETLRKEIAAGHFTLSHMAYFWCQGCSDRTQSAQWYVNKYLAMHSGLKTEMSFDHDSNADTADKTFEFGGIIPVRVGSTATCYRDGVYSVSNPYAYHESFVDLRFSGPRVAQYWMINNPELSDIWGVCDIGDNWVWMPDGTNGVADYFNAHYENGTVDYTTQVQQKASWYKPTTPKAVHDSIHYNQIGYNEYGREAVRNALIMLGEMESPDVETTVELLSWDGYTPVEQVTASTAGNSGTLVVPKVYPIWKSKDIAYELSEGLTWDYYDLLAADVQTEGTLTAGGQTVCVAKAEPGVHYAEHLSELPEDICCGLNLWPLLEHDSEFYYGGTHWATHGTKDVMSVTIPIIPGDKIFATAFGKAGQNGHDTSNGIRVTFFSEYGVAKTMAPAECYAEFSANGGYLVAPENATAINVVMWNNSDENELYLLDRAHDTDSGICGICGKDSHIHSWSGWQMKEIPGKGEPVTEERVCSGCGETETREVESVWQKYDLAAHYSDLPENVCNGLNLWNILEHDKYYFANGTNWSIYSGGTVKSVTISVEPGDVIFATAWGKAGENGHATADGIRVSFFDVYGVAKTMTPAECYAEFSKNGGYLIAPEGAIAVNVAMWNNSNENEIYILNRDHTYKNGICTGCGATASGELVPVKNRLYLETEGSVWIDGQEYVVQQADGIRYVDIPDETAKVMTTYTYGTIDGETYPIGMKVWILENRDGFYSATHQSAFDDLLRYEGCSIRITGKQGIRMITSIDEGNKKALVGAGLAGYTLKEYGTAIAWARQLSDRKPLVLGKSYVNHNFAYSREAGKDPVFDSRDGRMQYTNVLVGFGLNQCSKEIALRPYMILEDAEGNAITIYGGVVERSIHYIASKIQQKNLYAPESEEYKYLQKIIESSSPAK